MTAVDTWMELRYGLRPIVSLIESIIEEVERKRRAFDPNRIRSARALKSRTRDYQTTCSGNTSLFANTLHLQLTTTITWRAVVYYKCDYDREGDFASLYGLSPEYLPETLWQLTGRSFVVDWLWSVSEWLGSFRVKPGISILGNTVSRKELTHGMIVPEVEPLYANTEMIGSDDLPPTTYFSEKYERRCDQKLSSTPIWMGFSEIDLFRTLDSLSLILQPILKSAKRRHYQN